MADLTGIVSYLTGVDSYQNCEYTCRFGDTENAGLMSPIDTGILPYTNTYWCRDELQNNPPRVPN